MKYGSSINLSERQKKKNKDKGIIPVDPYKFESDIIQILKEVGIEVSKSIDLSPEEEGEAKEILLDDFDEVFFKMLWFEDYKDSLKIIFNKHYYEMKQDSESYV